MSEHPAQHTRQGAGLDCLMLMTTRATHPGELPMTWVPGLIYVVDLTATSFASTLPLYQHCDIASYFVSVGIEGHGVVGGTCCVAYLDTTFATH